MQPGLRGKERLKGEERKAQIIDTALTLFAKKGFDRTRTKEIADIIGVSEALIFQHFKTKEGLIKAALAALFHSHPLSDELKKQLKEAEADEASFFQTIAMHFIKHNRGDPRIMKLALYSSLEGGHFGELTRADETGPSILTLITGYIQKKVDEGVFVKTNAGIAARFFVEAIFMYIADQEAAIIGPVLPFSDEEVVTTLVDIYLRGLKKK